MIFRQLFDAPTGTYTYLLGDKGTRDAILIDPVFEQHARDRALLRELDLKLRCTVDTHVHADHVTGAWLMKETTGSSIAISEAAGVKAADVQLKHGDLLKAGEVRLEARSTPGHTDGCMSLVEQRERLVFTGDALLIRGAGRTDFQQGSANLLFRSIHEQLFSLDDDFRVYPGHDYNGRTMTTVAEEKEHNPRISVGVREEDFVGYMNNLGLAHPKRLDVALPANLKAGRPDDDFAAKADTTWGPVLRTYAGVCQIDAEWVHQNRQVLTVIDVRERAELGSGEIGLIEGAKLIPLSELRNQAASLPRERPLIMSCPTGARSQMATTILEGSGIKRVANLQGGVAGWQSLGLPTTSNAPTL